MISTVVQYSIERVVQIIKYLYRIDYVVWEMGLMRWWIISWTWDDQRERRIIRLTKWMNKWVKDSFEVDDIVKTLISNDRETHIHLSINKRKHNKWQTIYYYDKPHLKNNHTYRYMDASMNLPPLPAIAKGTWRVQWKYIAAKFVLVLTWHWHMRWNFHIIFFNEYTY